MTLCIVAVGGIILNFIEEEHMKVLNEQDMQQVNGGFGSLIYWGIRGGIYLYRTYSATQLATGAGFAAGAGVTIAAELDE